jgi:hypothetical protein
MVDASNPRRDVLRRSFGWVCLSACVLASALGCSAGLKNGELVVNGKPALRARPAQETAERRIDPKWPETTLVAQRRSDWCWAACCEMASRALRKPRTQEEFVAALFGSDNAASAQAIKNNTEEFQAATEYEIARALSGESLRDTAKQPTPDAKSKKYLVIDTGELVKGAVQWAQVQSMNSIAVEELNRRRPVILGLDDWNGIPGHAVFVLSMRVIEEEDGVADWLDDLGTKWLGESKMPKPKARYRILEITFFDPYYRYSANKNPSASAPSQDGASSDGIVVFNEEQIEKHGRFLMSPKMAEAILACERSAIYTSNRRKR